MSYSFQPLRFALSLIGLSIVIAILNGTLRHLAGFGLPQAAIGVLTIAAAVGIEGNLCGRRSGGVPPGDALCRRSAVSMAIWGTLTFLGLGVIGLLLAGATPGSLPPGLLLKFLGTIAIYSATLLIVGYLLFRAVARRVAAERA
ncbi:ABZJ_00895 family protein [Poseidonocella sp. HB161398]|uniref:ABZJ_00895 family protein n=1 Tax=Poseidonocella sp. HB161398 TaxID=2320855 RepID=UPI001107A8BD|nr:ABZJ_00895 family protein [Poseidonocella sp. HB161398]